MILRLLLFLPVFMLLCFQAPAADGRFVRFPHNSSLPAKYVTGFTRDPQGDLWIGTLNGVAQLHADSINVYRPVSPYGHKDGLVKGFAADSAGFHLLTNSCSYTFSPATRSLLPGVPREDSGKDSQMRYFLDARGHRWSYNPEVAGSLKADAVRVPDKLRKSVVKDIVQLSPTSLLFATDDNGLLNFDLSSGDVADYAVYGDSEGSLPDRHVTTLFLDSSIGRLWIGTARHGAFYTDLYSPSVTFTPLSTTEPVSSFAAVGKDLWVATDGGGVFLIAADGKSTSFTTENSALPLNIVLSLFPRGKGGELIGTTYGAGIFVLDTDTRKFAPFKVDDPDRILARARSLAWDANGCLWVGTMSKGLARISPKGEMKVFNIANSALRTDYINDISASADGKRIFVATGFGIYEFLTDGSGRLFCPEENMVAAQVIAVAGDGSVWFGASDGLFRTSDLDTPVIRDSIISLESYGKILWCASSSSLYRVDLSGDSPIINKVSLPSGENAREIAKYALYPLPDGVLVGGNGGFWSVSDQTDSESQVSSLIWLWVLISVVVVVAIVVSVILYRRRKQRIIVKAEEIHRRAEENIHSVEEKLQTAEEKPQSAAVDSPVAVPVIRPDDRFLEKISRIVDDNLADEGFSVEQFGNAVGMSRSNLYKKTMAVTGLSPQEFVRNRRLDRAREMILSMRDSKLPVSISEIAFRVGMSPRQFSRHFKQRFGILPSSLL